MNKIPFPINVISLDLRNGHDILLKAAAARSSASSILWINASRATFIGNPDGTIWHRTSLEGRKDLLAAHRTSFV